MIYSPASRKCLHSCDRGTCFNEEIGCDLCHDSCSECSGFGNSNCTLCSDPYSWLTPARVCQSCSKEYDPTNPNCQFITELKLKELKDEKDISSSATLEIEFSNLARFKEIMLEITSENLPEYFEVCYFFLSG